MSSVFVKVSHTVLYPYIEQKSFEVPFKQNFIYNCRQAFASHRVVSSGIKKNVACNFIYVGCSR